MSEVMMFVGSKCSSMSKWNGSALCACIPVNILNPHPKGRHLWDRRNEKPCGDSDLFHSSLTSPIYGELGVTTDLQGNPAQNLWQKGTYGTNVKYLFYGDTGWYNSSPWGSIGMSVSVVGGVNTVIERYEFSYDYPTGKGSIYYFQYDTFQLQNGNLAYHKRGYNKVLDVNQRTKLWPGRPNTTPNMTLDQIRNFAPFYPDILESNAIGDGKYTVLSNCSYHQGLAEFNFRYGEYSTYQCMQELQVWHDYRFEAGCSAAYMNAVDCLPEASCNSIANIIDIISGLKSLSNGYRAIRGVSNLAKEAWLGYRYAYNTTKMDICEYASLASRLLQITTEDIKCYGTYQDDRGRYTCAVAFSVKDALPQDLVSKVKNFGFELNAVNVWDIIPYSFVADWFLHIGDILTDLETWNKGMTLKPTELWFTMSTSYLTINGIQDTFIRVRGSVPPRAICFRYKEASSRTLFMRLMDAWALFIG